MSASYALNAVFKTLTWALAAANRAKTGWLPNLGWMRSMAETMMRTTSKGRTARVPRFRFLIEKGREVSFGSGSIGFKRGHELCHLNSLGSSSPTWFDSRNSFASSRKAGAQ